MYRFRKVEYLLDEKYEELERQEIYFASSEELNDPMEGIRDIFWQGDEVLWRNFINHYLMCLEHVTNIWNVTGEERRITKDYIPVFKNKMEFSSVRHKERFIKIKDYFFSNKIIKNMPFFLAENSKKIRYNDLLKYLKVIHKFAFDAINFVDSNYGYTNRVSIFKNILNDDSMIMLIENAGDREDNVKEDLIFEEEIENVFTSLNNINSNADLLDCYGDEGRHVFSNKTFIMIQFPEAYLQKVEELIYPKWYASCFMNDCTNLTSWGTYADNHKGVCLKFRTESTENANGNSHFLKLTGVMGEGNCSVIGSVKHELLEMNYIDKLYEIDFFNSLGRLSYPKFNEEWYADESKVLSSSLRNMVFDEEWLQHYIEGFHKSVMIKNRAYSYEGEYRIILDELCRDYESSEDRKLKYDFNDLEGIIFGIKTSSSDKAKIIDIIRRKCNENGRKNFEFYEAEYSHITGKIIPVKMKVLL